MKLCWAVISTSVLVTGNEMGEFILNLLCVWFLLFLLVTVIYHVNSLAYTNLLCFDENKLGFNQQLSNSYNTHEEVSVFVRTLTLLGYI